MNTHGVNEVMQEKTKGKNGGKMKVKLESKSYMQWNLNMERVLADTLREERGLGHKGDNGWKSIAYNTAASILSAQFGIQVTADNVKNRVKLWKKYYGIVSDILGQSGFSWDSSTQMISVDETYVWEEYVKSHDEAASFRYKRIQNWEDIVDLCGKDRANGAGAETCDDAAEVMTPLNNARSYVDLDGDDKTLDDIDIVEEISPSHASFVKRRNEETSSCNVPPPKRKCTTKDVLGTSVDRMASSFEALIRATTTSLTPKEVYTEIMAIPELPRDIQIKACAWFIENEKQFLMVKEVPLDMKKDMVMIFVKNGSE